MAMQAVIMAGGAGMRLRPMTCDCPKPLLPLCGAPVMDYALRLLARHGYDRAAVTLYYRPQPVRLGQNPEAITAETSLTTLFVDAEKNLYLLKEDTAHSRTRIRKYLYA